MKLLLRQSSEVVTDKLAGIFPSRLFQLVSARTAEEIVARIASQDVDVVLLDVSIPAMENKRTFDAVRSLSPAPPVMVFGDVDSTPTMSSFLRHGATGMFTLQTEPDVIIHQVRQAVLGHRLARENAELRDTLIRKEKAVDILEHLGEAMSTVFDTRRILNLTLKIVRRALDCEICSLFLIHEGSGELVDSREIGRDGASLQLALWGEVGRGRQQFLLKAARRSIKSSEGLCLNRPEEITALFPESRVQPVDDGIRSLLTAPLTVKRRHLGVLVVANRIGRPGFSGEEIEVLQSIARQTALALEGVRSLERETSFQEKLSEQVDLATTRLKERNLDLQKRLAEKERANRKINAMAEEIRVKNLSLKNMIEQFRVIHEISQVIGSELENETLIKKIISEAASLLRAETVSIMLRNGDGNLRIKHALGLSNEVIKNTRVKQGEGISGWVMEEGKPILVKDVKSVRKEPANDTKYTTDSLLCVPLKIKGKNFGVLNVTNRSGGGAFDERDLFLLTILGNHAAVAIENARLYGTIRDNYFNTIKALVNAVEAKDTWTKDHSENVTNYSLKIADFLGLSEKQKDTIKYAGVLHDIGKIVISNSITDKPTSLTDDEWEIMREHPLIGQRILDPIDFLEPVKICIQTHHERCDGSGYPFGLMAHEIPLETRILSVADAFDAMIHSRPYRAALSVGEAVAELKRSSGSQFDPAVVDGLIRIVEAEALMTRREQ
ncbi:MAG: GAF domain-containing protein [bacterium]|nr:MAG: GAF domain-containing protein [bacterium]